MRTESTLSPFAPARHRVRVLLVGAALAVLVFGFFVASIGLDYTGPIRTTQILFGGGTPTDNVVIFDNNIPRGLIAVLAGAAFGIAGAFTQTIARNPLATPDILGVTAGAAVGGTATIALTGALGSVLSALTAPGAAVLTGLLTAGAMYLLAWSRGGEIGMNTLRLILVGVGMTWTLQALTGYIISRVDFMKTPQLQRWLVGSLADANSDQIGTALLAVAIGVVWALLSSRQLSILALGPDTARGLGVRVGLVTGGTLVVAVIVAALAVATTGPIAFVGLLAPQIAQRLGRLAYPPPVLSAVTGALLVIAADLACRTVLPSGLSVGIVTAAVGGPSLIYLMLRLARKASL